MPKKPAQDTAALERALERCERAVMTLRGVTGVALGEADGHPCLVVYVEALTPALRARIAPEYGGVPVKIEGAGRFEAQ